MMLSQGCDQKIMQMDWRQRVVQEVSIHSKMGYQVAELLSSSGNIVHHPNDDGNIQHKNTEHRR